MSTHCALLTSRFVSTMKGGGTDENGTGVSLCSPPVIGDPGASITDASTSTNGTIDLSSNTSFSQKFPKHGLSTGRTDINKDECNPKNPPHDSNKYKWQGAHKNYMPGSDNDNKGNGNRIGAQVYPHTARNPPTNLHTTADQVLLVMAAQSLLANARWQSETGSAMATAGSPIDIDDKHKHECPAK